MSQCRVSPRSSLNAWKEKTSVAPQTSSLYPNHYSDQTILTFRGPCIVIYSYNKANKLQIYFDKVRYMFLTDLLSIIRSLNTVYTATGICHTRYVD